MRRPRYEPYTAIGIRRVPCSACGARKSLQQWSACADFHAYHALCNECDIKLNRLALEFVNAPDVDKTIAAYRARLEEKYGAAA